MLQSLDSVFSFVLHSLVHVTHDWGLAVVLLTTGVRLLLLPLTLKAAKSSIRQRQLTPKLQAMAKSWHGSRQKLSQAQQSLLRSSGVRPFTALLPLLLQAPVFFTLYRFFLKMSDSAATTVIVPWVTHIALADPFHILPLVAAVAVAAGGFVNYVPMAPTSAATWLSCAIGFGSTLLVLWQAPVAACLYYATSSIGGSIERLAVGKFLRHRWAIT